MLPIVKELLDIQEKDMQMLRLIRLRKERMNELKNLSSIRNDLSKQLSAKKEEAIEIKSRVKLLELELEETKERIVKVEKKQDSVKKVEEFNVLSQEIAQAEREKNQIRHKIEDESERVGADDEILKKLQESLSATENNLKVISQEVQEAVVVINEEGRRIKKERDQVVVTIPEEYLKIYTRLLNNKKNRVVVPIETRTCMGCHIMITAQHENLVRRAERLVFCEHCSRIHFMPEASTVLEEEGSPKKRRRCSVNV
jgi:uncharacterized protein